MNLWPSTRRYTSFNELADLGRGTPKSNFGGARHCALLHIEAYCDIEPSVGGSPIPSAFAVTYAFASECYVMEPATICVNSR